MPQLEEWYNSGLLTFIKDHLEGISKDDLVMAKVRNEISFNYTDIETLIKLNKIIEKNEKYYYLNKKGI